MTAVVYKLFKTSLLIGCLALSMPGIAAAAESAHAVARDYPVYADAPATQLPGEVAVKNDGCMSCHLETDQPSMHASGAVNLACVDCHGGDPRITLPAGVNPGDPDYDDARDHAHVLPLYPDD